MAIQSSSCQQLWVSFFESNNCRQVWRSFPSKKYECLNGSTTVNNFIDCIPTAVSFSIPTTFSVYAVPQLWVSLISKPASVNTFPIQQLSTTDSSTTVGDLIHSNKTVSVFFHFNNSALSIYIQLGSHGRFFFSFIPATLLLVSIQLNSHESLFSIPTTLPLVYIQLSNLESFFVLIPTTLLLVSIQSNNHESFFSSLLQQLCS